jgi:hypothetical protein
MRLTEDWMYTERTNSKILLPTIITPSRTCLLINLYRSTKVQNNLVVPVHNLYGLNNYRVLRTMDIACINSYLSQEEQVRHVLVLVRVKKI